MHKITSTGSMPTAWIMLRIRTCFADRPAPPAAVAVVASAMSRLP